MKFRFLKDKNEYITILKNIDKMFPIALSYRISLESLAEKTICNGNVLCCYIDGDFAGQIAFYCNDLETKEGYFSTLAVLPQFQGRGIAKALLKEAVEECRKSGMKTVRLYTHSNNATAIKMYNSFGFKEKTSDRDGDIKFILEI